MSVPVQLLGAFLGSLGFALLFNVRGRKVLPAACGGLISWGVYLLIGLITQNDVLRYLAASVIITVYSELLAYAMKSPATVFVVSGTIPLIPGGLLYSAMRYAVQQNWREFFYGSMETLMLAMAIAGGILFGMTTLRSIKVLFGKSSPVPPGKR